LIMAGDPDTPHHFEQELTLGQAQDRSGAPIVHLLVCTKAWAVEEALRAITHRLSTKSSVVILCNGMISAKRITPAINGARLVWATTTAGCRRDEAGRLIPSGAGETQLGADLPAGKAPGWLSGWERGVPNCRWELEIRSTLLAKLAVNAVINPLTAIHQVTNGALLTAPLAEDTERLTREVQALLRAGGADQIAEALPARVSAVCSQTAENHSSMRVDVERGRPTEIEAIAGWLLSEWVDEPPSSPFLERLYQAIRRGEALGISHFRSP
jgi:2-dehydropantoate 2-reductase